MEFEHYVYKKEVTGEGFSETICGKQRWMALQANHDDWLVGLFFCLVIYKVDKIGCEILQKCHSERINGQ